MAEFKFDGKYFKQGSTKIENVRNNKICKGSGSSCLSNIRGDKVCDGPGSITIATLWFSFLR